MNNLTKEEIKMLLEAACDYACSLTYEASKYFKMGTKDSIKKSKLINNKADKIFAILHKLPEEE